MSGYEPTKDVCENMKEEIKKSTQPNKDRDIQIPESCMDTLYDFILFNPKYSKMHVSVTSIRELCGHYEDDNIEMFITFKNNTRPKP